MSRNLDTALSADLTSGLVHPVVFAQITFWSGTEYVWSGIGDFVWDGKTFTGLGDFVSMGPIGEGSAVKADGTTVTLSGIGLSLIDIPGQVPTPPDPPFPPAPGESVAWSYATAVGGYSFNINPAIPVGGAVFSDPPSIWNANLGFSGNAEYFSNTSGFLGLLNGQTPVAGRDGVVLGFGRFRFPPEIPIDAVITHVYPVANWGSSGPGGDPKVGCLPSPPGDNFNGVGLDVHTLGGRSIRASLENSVPGEALLGMDISFVGMAVYYIGTPKTKMTLLQEALGDVRLGAPAKIWYGHMSSGALVGAPYLIFSGTVDKPTIQIDEKTSTITLALENRLVNLQRANQRRYTAADQRISYPTDMAFNWVETLNDIALRWGS